MFSMSFSNTQPQHDGMETPIEPNRTVSQRTELNRTEPYRARQRASREWKYKLKVEMKVRVPFELQSVSQSALSSGSRAAN